MSTTKKKIDEDIDLQESLLKGIRADYHKMIDGNASAILRMRNAEMELSKLCKSIRINLLTFKEEVKAAKKK